MPNTVLTPSMITKEILMILENNLVFLNRINRTYDARFGVSGAKIGATLDVRKPARFTVSDGPILQPQAYTETSVPITVNHQLHVDVVFGMAELTLSMDDYSNRVLKPQISQLANEVDRLAQAEMYPDVYNYVGVPGTIPSALLTYLEAGALLSEEAAPVAGRTMMIGPRPEVAIVDNLKGLFQSSTQIAEQYEEGMMGRAAGFNWFMSQNIPTHQVGLLGGAPLVDGANQTGSNILTDGWTGSVATRLRRGDIVQFAGVYAVNPMSRVSTGQLRNFVVTADTDSDGAGVLTIPISPAIVTSGPLQNVSNSPANNAPVTTFGHADASSLDLSPQGMAFCRDAFTAVSVDLEVPRGVHFAGRMSDSQLGLSVRIVRQYDVNTDSMPCRVDLLIGYKTLRPELAVRIAS